jgi:hypothetical protein
MRLATWVYFGILLIFGLIFSIGGNGPASEKVFVNSPVAIATMLPVISIFGIMLSNAIMGVLIYRDIKQQIIILLILCQKKDIYKVAF